MENNLPIVSEDILINMLESQKETKLNLKRNNETIIDHERRINELETNVPINATLNNYLTRLRNRVIIDFMGGKQSKAYKHRYPKNSKEHYKTLTNKVYAEAERRFKTMFDVRVYGEIRQHQYEDAVLFWEEYEPSAKTLREINQVNNQLELFESEGAKA